MRLATLSLALILMASLLGCATQEHAALTGGAIGVGAGAVIGHQSKHAPEGALIGGTAGLIGGYAYGKHKAGSAASGAIEKYVNCPRCHRTLHLPADATPGDKIKCLACQTVFMLK